MGVGVNPPKTPVTEGSGGIAVATLPNVCKMPGPPAPFVPAPLPSIGKSSDTPKGYTKKVKVEGKAVAIAGASFGSKGDIASQGTGGGMISANVQGPCKFIGPGSTDVKFEGGNVQLLSDPMTNNGAGSGDPANAATMAGLLQNPEVAASFKENPDNDDQCGAGNHDEELHRPRVPPGEEKVAGRIKVIKDNIATDGDGFEERAARYNNEVRKDLSHGNQLSRRITPLEKATGLHEEDQKIWLICKICKHRREVDEAPGDKSVVEAKSTEDAVSGGKQKKNNAALLAKGFSVAYKSPHIDYKKYVSWTEEGFEMLNIPKSFL